MAGNLWSSCIWAIVATGALENGKVWANGETGINLEIVEMNLHIFKVQWAGIYEVHVWVIGAIRSKWKFVSIPGQKHDPCRRGRMCTWLRSDPGRKIWTFWISGPCQGKPWWPWSGRQKFPISFAMSHRTTSSQIQGVNARSRIWTKRCGIQIEFIIFAKVLNHIYVYMDTWSLEGNVEVWKKNLLYRVLEG